MFFLVLLLHLVLMRYFLLIFLLHLALCRRVFLNFAEVEWCFLQKFHLRWDYRHHNHWHNHVLNLHRHRRCPSVAMAVHDRMELKNLHLKIGSVDLPRRHGIDGLLASCKSMAGNERVKIIASRRIMDWT